MAENWALKDSGKREEMTTGSRRDTREGKGRFDLIPWDFLRELALLYEAGSVKYGDRNWEKGQPLSRYYDSAQRHLNNFMAGDESEPHLIQAIWNIIGIWWTQRQALKRVLPFSLLDIGPHAISTPKPDEATLIKAEIDYRQHIAKAQERLQRVIKLVNDNYPGYLRSIGLRGYDPASRSFVAVSPGGVEHDYSVEYVHSKSVVELVKAIRSDFGLNP